MSLQPTKLSPWSRKMIPPPPLVRCRWIWAGVFACRCRNPASFPSRLRCGGRCSLKGDCVETWWFDKSPDGLNKVDQTLGESCDLLQTGAILWFCILWGVEVWDEEDLRRGGGFEEEMWFARFRSDSRNGRMETGLRISWYFDPILRKVRIFRYFERILRKSGRIHRRWNILQPYQSASRQNILPIYATHQNRLTLLSNGSWHRQLNLVNVGDK